MSAATEIITATVGVLGFAYGAYENFHARNETRQLQQREQANRVHAWAEKHTGEGRSVVVENASDAPVHGVKAWLVTPDAPLASGTVPDKDPTTRRSVLERDGRLEDFVKTKRPPPKSVREWF